MSALSRSCLPEIPFRRPPSPAALLAPLRHIIPDPRKRRDFNKPFTRCEPWAVRLCRRSRCFRRLLPSSPPDWAGRTTSSSTRHPESPLGSLQPLHKGQQTRATPSWCPHLRRPTLWERQTRNGLSPWTWAALGPLPLPEPSSRPLSSRWGLEHSQSSSSLRIVSVRKSWPLSQVVAFARRTTPVIRTAALAREETGEEHSPQN